ncbi:MAG: hypothetical protein ABH840_03850 [Nanoarchaeota archaeon]
MDEELKDLTRRDLIKILAVVILSDGYLYKDRYLKLFTSSRSDCQHELFSYLCCNLFSKKPKKYNVKFNRNGLVETYLQSALLSKEAVAELLKLSHSYKTTCGKLEKQEFLRLPQPNISFLLNSRSKIRWLAFRTWFDFDGSISPFFKLRRKRDIKNGKNYNYFQVQFVCDIRIAETNPSLVAQLARLTDSLGLNAIIKKKNNWSGIDGICISRMSDVRKFVCYGPMTDVLVSRKSNRFEGIKKKVICLAVKKILDDDSILKSKYFKNMEQARIYKNQMDRILFSLVK